MIVGILLLRFSCFLRVPSLRREGAKRSKMKINRTQKNHRPFAYCIRKIFQTKDERRGKEKAYFAPQPGSRLNKNKQQFHLIFFIKNDKKST